MDQHNAAVHAEMGVGVALGRRAVCSPAGVANGDSAVKWRGLELGGKVGQLADVAPYDDFTVVIQSSDPGRIVTAILQSL